MQLAENSTADNNYVDRCSGDTCKGVFKVQMSLIKFAFVVGKQTVQPLSCVL